MTKTKARKEEERRKRRNVRRRALAAERAACAAYALLVHRLATELGASFVDSPSHLSEGCVYVRLNTAYITVANALRDTPRVRPIVSSCGTRRRGSMFSTWQLPVMRHAEELRRGRGFGANLWRYNYVLGGTELSFAGSIAPEDESFLEGRGFVWNNLLGRWYAPFSAMPAVDAKAMAECVFHLAKTEDVERR